MTSMTDSPKSVGSAPPKIMARDDREDVATSVVFIGALPPPLTSMTAMTAVIVDALQQQGPIDCYNWSRGTPLKGWRWKAARGWGALKSLAGLAYRGPARGATLYYPVSSGVGLYID